MYQTILMDADVDEGTEIGDVGDDAWQFHALDEVVDGIDTRVELEFFNLFAGVATRLFLFFEDIGKGRDAYLSGHVAFDIDGLALFLVTNQVGHSAVLVLGHLLDDVVALRMDGRVVERILGARDAEETCALLEGGRAETRHFFQLGARSEGTILLTIVDDILGEGGAKAADVHQKML